MDKPIKGKLYRFDNEAFGRLCLVFKLEPGEEAKLVIIPNFPTKDEILKFIKYQPSLLSGNDYSKRMSEVGFTIDYPKKGVVCISRFETNRRMQRKRLATNALQGIVEITRPATITGTASHSAVGFYRALGFHVDEKDFFTSPSDNPKLNGKRFDYSQSDSEWLTEKFQQDRNLLS